MEKHRPHGPTPTALEANILKLRAFEMVLTLFYVEDLRRLIIKAIKITDKIRGYNRLSKNLEVEITKTATRILLDEGIINNEQIKDFNELIRYRNTIAHEPHYAISDVGTYSILCRKKTSYDNSILDRAKKMREHLYKEIRKKFIIEIDIFNSFDSAEKSYLLEINRLNKKITTQIKKLEASINETNNSIKAIPSNVLDDAQPFHPDHYKKNGALSTNGIECIKKLYGVGATPLAVAHLMKISMVSAKRWKNRLI